MSWSKSSPRYWLAAGLIALLGVLDVLMGLEMFFAPGAFASMAGIPLGAPLLMQGYGQRVVLLGGFYLVQSVGLLRGAAWAERTMAVAFVDELLNLGLDLLNGFTGDLGARAVLSLLIFHGAFTAALLSCVWPRKAKGLMGARSASR